MYTNRIFYVLVGLALAAVTFFTLREAASTLAIGRADRSYDQVELARTSRGAANVLVDSSYDQKEAVRLARSVVFQDQSYDQVEILRSERGAVIADRTYDDIERLRAERAMNDSPVATAQAAPVGSQSVIAWNAIAMRTVVTIGGQAPAPSFVYAANVQAAVYNAVVAIEGGYQPYKSTISPQPGASVDAAVATAAHNVLAHYFPSQQAALDTDYATNLSAIPDGVAKTTGVSVGSAAADELIALRQGDGLNANIGFTMPTPGPGVWQLPAGVNPQAPWMSKLLPFMLESPDQFRPGPPPDLSSSEWATEYNEVRLYGRRDSTVRTPEQTATALFWSANPPMQYNLTFRQLAESRGLDAIEAARLMAMGDMVGADALTACWDAKYHYLFWRPAFAIPLGNTDGNPDTVGDSTFVPLLATPPHPEYPSAHGCLSSAEVEVFTEFFGTQHINVDIPSTVAGVDAHHFTNANDLTQEIINARVWGGLHYRESVIIGINVGRKVAHWALQRYFLPVP